MATTHQNFPPTELTTAWIPLEGLTQHWGDFGAEANTAPALHATSVAFAALAQETEALAYCIEAYQSSRDADRTDLEHCLDALLQAQQQWTETIYFLEQLALDERKTDANSDAIVSLITETMEQRLRVSMLIQEVEHEQLTTYCHLCMKNRMSTGRTLSSDGMKDDSLRKRQEEAKTTYPLFPTPSLSKENSDDASV